jgi:uncharacterized membrane protein YfcA
MLLIAVAIVPFWSALEPTEFAEWFREHSPLLGRVMVPLGAAATVLSLLAAVLARRVSAPSFRWWVVAAVLAVAVAAMYPLYFASANAALASEGLAPGEIAAELRRWRTWHQARTGAGVLAFLAGLHALRATSR